MKDLSRLAQGLEQSQIRAISAAVKAVDGINLGQGICDLPTPPPIREAAKDAIDANRSTYSAYDGIRRLRSGILEKAQRYNGLPATSVENVMVSAGSTGAFTTAVFTLFEPGDEVILFEPFYGYHRHLLELRGVTIRYVPLHRPDWSVDFDELEAAITERTKALLVCTPTNPCGKVWSREELTRVLELLQRHDLYAITDEIYEYMLYDGREHLSLGSLPGAFERTVTLSGFSKTYNMTGWRLGYAVGPEELIGRMGMVNDLVYICAPTPLQHGVAAAFEMPDSYFEELAADYAAKRQLMCETLETIGFDVPWPAGAYYVLADFSPLRERHDGFEDDLAACKTLIDRAHVGTVPGHAFYAEAADGATSLRFCFAKKMPDLERACRQLRDAFA